MAGTPPRNLRRLAIAMAGLLLLTALVLHLRRAPVPPPRPQWLFTGGTMGTSYTVKAVPSAANGPDMDAVAEAIRAALEDVNAKMSTYRPDSELSRFNSLQSTEPFPVSAETIAVFALAHEVSERSGGAFDVTVGPLVNLWGFGPEERGERPPTDDLVAALRERVGYRNVVADPESNTLRKTRPDIYCDLSAIAKGYGVDQAARALEAAGVTDYMVEVGGEVRTRGLNAHGNPWRIGIERPDTADRTVELVVPLRDKSLATSGDYRNYYEEDGVRLSHTIDPRTGRPIRHALASVTVIADDCAVADAYATALMVLGPEQGMALAKQLNLAAFFILRTPEGTHEERSTPTFDTLLAKNEQDK